MRTKYYCIDCRQEVSKTSHYGMSRCRSCARKYQYSTNPETHPMAGRKLSQKHIESIRRTNFKKGKPHCIDCNKIINYGYERCQSCTAKKRFKNPKHHPSYIDGRSYKKYPREFNESLREAIRGRDNYTCQNCNMTEEEHLIVHERILHVHHIDYNRNNCAENNLITLCQQCNLRANSNRGYWQDFYTEKIGDIYEKQHFHF